MDNRTLAAGLKSRPMKTPPYHNEDLYKGILAELIVLSRGYFFDCTVNWMNASNP